MASYVTPEKNAEFIFYVSLVQQADTKLFQSNPTLAAGDVKVSTDGGALGNLGTLPVVTPGSSKLVKVTLSASEMNGDNIQVVFSDAAGAEWCDLVINIQTTVRQIDDLVFSATPDLEAVIADSIPADGTRPSIRQALLQLTRFLFERDVVATTMTVKKEDGSTSSMTFTLNSATDPTSITRAT